MPDDRPIIPPLVRVAQTGAVPVRDLNDKSKNNAQAQATVAGAGSVLPIIYGERRVGAKIGAIVAYAEELWILAAWCRGEVESVSEFAVDDLVPGDQSDITSRTYLGSQNQPVDPTLVQAFALQGVAYADTLPGVCYSVFRIVGGQTSSFPRLTARVRGMRVRATQFAVPAYSDNPALCIADFIESPDYGMGRHVDWATVASAAAACDADVGGERKRILGVALDTPQTGEAWLNVLRDYAGCWIVPEGNLYRLVPDVAGSSVGFFTPTNIVEKSLKLDKRGTRAVPTCVEVTYTDTSQIPWRDATATVFAPGVLAGTVPRRMSRIQKPGIFRHSEAHRYAVERLNDALLGDLSISFVAFDEALAIQVGDLINVTHPIGLTEKTFRTLRVDPKEPGRWTVNGQEYDPAKYSSAVVTVPSTPDTTFPSPFEPPAVLGLTATEDLYQTENGIWASRVKLTWALPNYPYLAGYAINIYEGGTLKETSLISGVTSYLTKALREETTYTASIAIFSTFGVTGVEASASITTIGKTAIPGDVPSFTGFEAGGRVFLYWTPAIDLDIWRYELRYGSFTGSWETARVIDVVDALAYEAAGLAAGPWRFYIKAVDSVRNQSANAKHIDITVSLDDAAFLLGTKNFDEIGPPYLANMTQFTLRGDPPGSYYCITDFGDPLNYGHANPDNATGSFGDDGFGARAFCDPHTVGGCYYVTTIWDIGTLLTGNFTANVPVTTISGGPAQIVIATSTDGVAWTSHPEGPSVKTTARFVRVYVSNDLSSGSILVKNGTTVRVDALTKTESGNTITNAGGPVRVTLKNRYVTAKSIQVSAQGTVPRIVLYDNVIIGVGFANSFDIYLFNSSLAQISGPVSWIFEGF